MRRDAQSYRDRAAHCRQLAKAATDPAAVASLLQVARDFEEETDQLTLDGQQSTSYPDED